MLHQGVLVLARTFGKVGSYTLCGREAALLGPVAAAAHNLMFNLGVATTQVCESVAVATQTLLAREMGGLNAALSSEEGSDAQRAAALQVKRERSWHIIRRGCGLGGFVATTLSLGIHTLYGPLFACEIARRSSLQPRFEPPPRPSSGRTYRDASGEPYATASSVHRPALYVHRGL